MSCRRTGRAERYRLPQVGVCGRRTAGAEPTQQCGRDKIADSKILAEVYRAKTAGAGRGLINSKKQIAMETHQIIGEAAARFAADMEELKALATPDKEAVEALRSRLDAAADAGEITVREWRELVEKCAHIRRAPRG